MVNFEYRQFPQSSHRVRQDLQQVLREMQISEGLQPRKLGQVLQLVFGDVEAGESPEGVHLLGQTGELVVVQPEL